MEPPQPSPPNTILQTPFKIFSKLSSSLHQPWLMVELAAAAARPIPSSTTPQTTRVVGMLPSSSFVSPFSLFHTSLLTHTHTH